MFCSKCGKECADDAVFCSSCGFAFKGACTQTEKTELLTLESFLATSEEYKKATKPLGITGYSLLGLSFLLLFIFIYGAFTLNWFYLELSGILFLVLLFLCFPLIMWAVKLDKKGKQLYKEYIESRK